MTQFAQLSEDEIEDRFITRGERPVAFMLAGFAKEGVQFSVNFGGGQEMFLTTLLAVKAERGLLIFDCSGSAESNRRILMSERNVFVGAPGGIRVQFAIGRVSEMIYGGSKAFSAALPVSLFRLQRREFFRIEVPRAKPLPFAGRMPDGGLLVANVHDLSVAGIGLIATRLPDGLAVGNELANCHFSLAGDDHEFFFSATVRYQIEREARGGLRQWRIGLQFKALPLADEKRLQRTIARLERERHELL